MTNGQMMVSCISAVAAVSGSFSQASGQPARPAGQIHVQGEAEVLIAPDEVVLTLGVETLDRDLQASKRQNDERVKRIIESATKAGVDPKHLKTEHISIEPVYKYRYTDNEAFVGYQCRKTIVVTVKDVDRFETILTGGLENGANYVHGVQFRTTELRKYRDQARALAIKAAKEKAADMAREFGETIGHPTSITEGYSGWWSWYGSSWGGAGRGMSMSQNIVQSVGGGSISSDSSIAPGQISVRAQVSATFGLSETGS